MVASEAVAGLQLREAVPKMPAEKRRDQTVPAVSGADAAVARLQANAGRLGRAGRAQEAIALLNRAIDLDPSNAGIRFDLGLILLHCGRIAQAADAFATVIRLDRKHAFAHHYFGIALARQGRVDQAIAAQRAATAIAPKLADAHYQLAGLLWERGWKEQAAKAFERVAAASAGTTSGRCAAAQALMVLDRLEEALVLLERARALDPKSADLLHLLGKALIEAGRFRDAEARLTEALAIVGMPRSGTTLVEQILSSHPEVAAGGELGFWGQAIAQLGGGDVLSRDVQRNFATRYLSVLAGISSETLRVTDKNPFNFRHLGLIHMALPDAFIIHCQRHPVDTCLSILTTNLTAHDISFMGNREDLVFYYRQYERLMRHWREVLPADRFLEVDYEALVSDREAQTRRLIAFCGLQWDDACLQPERNQRAVRTASVWQARQPVYRTSVERWRNYEPWLGALAELLPPS